MKAILVINVPEEYGEITDNKATVNIKNWKLGTSLTGYNIPLKPLPEKAKYTFKKTSMWWGICKGWNACLEEIEE